MVAKWWGISVGFVGRRGCGERFFVGVSDIFSSEGPRLCQYYLYGAGGFVHKHPQIS